MPIVFSNRGIVTAPAGGGGGGGGGLSPTLWVNGSTGDDSRSKATVAASGGALPWQTIGRAAWGSTTRGSPNTAEAADAGDVVSVAAGTYTYSGTVNERSIPVYNCVNSGTVTDPITFQAVGNVRLAAPSAHSPVAGAYQTDYIHWKATSGSQWLATCDGRHSSDPTAADSTVVNTRDDTGPLVAWLSTGTVFERWDVDGGPQTDYTDNWNCVRGEEAPETEVRNCTFYSFHNASDSINSTAVTLYGCPDSIIEHNDFSDVVTGVMFKDHGSLVNTNQGTRVRYNRITARHGVAFSMTSEGRNFIYQNLFIDCDHGVFVTGGGFSNDWFYNNTFVGCRDGFGSGTVMTFASASGSGGRFWGNIFYDCDYIITLNGFTMPADTVLDFEHNLCYTFNNYYTGSDGNRSFASFIAAYADQDQASPASVNSDPLFVNAGAGNYKLQAGSPAENLSVDMDDLDGDSSTVDTITAGCYITGSEVMGVEP